MKSISFKDVKNGEAIDYIDSQIQKIVDNINDPNTDATKKRTLVINVEFNPDATRDMVIINVDAKRKSAPDLGVKASVYIQQSGGVPYMTEQLSLNELVEKVQPKMSIAALKSVNES